MFGLIVTVRYLDFILNVLGSKSLGAFKQGTKIISLKF